MRVLALSLILRWVAGAAAPQALSVTPSTQWYGDDGTWSAISIRVGSPAQWVDVFVSTVSSETWVVGTRGCDNSELDSIPEIGWTILCSEGTRRKSIWPASVCICKLTLERGTAANIPQQIPFVQAKEEDSSI
jgi:hypothetical protein